MTIPTKWQELENLPTLSVSQVDSLKFDDDSTRVWLCRCGIDDGMPSEHTVTIERLIDGRWEIVRTIES